MAFEIALDHRIGEAHVALDLTTSERTVAIVGPSGSGKTTLLQCVAGLIRPRTGRIVIDGKVLFDAALGIDLPPERRRTGYVFQDTRLFPHRKVSANLAFGARLAPAGTDRVDRAEVVDLLGIGSLLDRRPASLSGGEAKRVAIGRALLASPRVLLFDEPLSSLDAARRDTILALIERIRERFAIPVLYVSHDMNEVSRLARTVVTLGR